MNGMDRFLEKTTKTDGCWIWTGAASRGRAYFHDDVLGDTLAARAAYRMFRGPFDVGLCVLHECDNPLCVNPDHLFLGTNAHNTADKVAKGRQSKGEAHGLSKLCNKDVKEIRVAWANGIAVSVLCDVYHVHKVNLYSILYGKTWSHVTDELGEEETRLLLERLKPLEEARKKDRSEKYSRNSRIGLAKKQEEIAARTHKVCKGLLCLKEDVQGVSLPVGDFYLKGKNTQVRQSICKRCFNERSRLARLKCDDG